MVTYLFPYPLSNGAIAKESESKKPVKKEDLDLVNGLQRKNIAS